MQKKGLSCVLVAIGLLGLAGCHHKNTAAGAGAGEGGGVQTFGSNDSAAMAGNDLAGGAGSEQTSYEGHVAGQNETYYFTFDSDRLDANQLQQINAQARYLLEHTNARIRLEGNTDNLGSREYNIALGYRRAQAVARVLAQQGVSQNRMATVSYGKEKPAALGDSEEARAKNRRVNLVYEAR